MFQSPNKFHSESNAQRVVGLRTALAASKREHFRLIWVVGGTASDRTNILSGIADEEGGAFLNVGKLLSTALIDIPSSLRAVSVDDAFSEILSNAESEVLCLDRLEILFDHSLMLQPIELVRNASRRFLLVASWPGTFSEDFLIFGPDDHPAHLKISRQDLECLVYPI